MKTARVYVDGFNLFYGALKGTPYKWLDLHTWASVLMPGYQITAVIYCTARVVNRPDDPSASTKQDVYLRALGTLGELLEMHEGLFSVRPKLARRLPRALCECCAGTRDECDCCQGPTVRIEKTEEKGSDVNLAVSLVRDAALKAADAALVVSGDSDIQGAVDVAQKFGMHIVVADPRNGQSLHGDERRTVRSKSLQAAQFPESVTSADGRVIRKPDSW